MIPTEVSDNNFVDDWLKKQEEVFETTSIGWKGFFALIPPRRYGNGLWAFGISLFFIGVVTAIVAEFANLFGCVLTIK